MSVVRSSSAEQITNNEQRRTNNFYIVVEKILARDEQLPSDFPVSGTTGYDFLDAVNAVFVDSDGLKQLDAFYCAFTGVTSSFADIRYEKKKQVIQELFSGEMRSLGKKLSAIAMADRNARDFAPVDLTAALTEVTACLSVYRTYMREGGPSPAERHTCCWPIAGASTRPPTAGESRSRCRFSRTCSCSAASGFSIRDMGGRTWLTWCRSSTPRPAGRCASWWSRRCCCSLASQAGSRCGRCTPG